MIIFTYLVGAYSRSENMWFTIKYIVVATLFLCVLWFISRWLTKQNFNRPGMYINVVQTTGMLGGKSFVLIEVQGIYYLLAMDKNNIVLIDQYTDFKKHEQTTPESDFLNQLKASLLRRENKNKE